MDTQCLAKTVTHSIEAPELLFKISLLHTSSNLGQDGMNVFGVGVKKWCLLVVPVFGFAGDSGIKVKRLLKISITNKDDF